MERSTRSAGNRFDSPPPEWQLRADRDVDRALRSLSFAIDFSGNSGSSLLLHSARVALLLGALGYSRDVQVAGALHDILEETRHPVHDIAHDFGDDVAYLVAANTLDATIPDEDERYHEAFGRCLEAGPAATIVMLADLYDTAPYADEGWLDKPRYFLERSRRMIGHEAVWRLLSERVSALEEMYQEQRALLDAGSDTLAGAAEGDESLFDNEEAR